ncbi:MAG: eukaryotic translation initiation factor 2 subunit gamma [Marteilia pararefringens]
MPEIIEYQATMNIGTVGHVSHGKTTLVKAISETNTVKFRDEMVRNITIKLGYANAKIFCCDNPDHPSPQNYESHSSSHVNQYPCKRPGCNGTYRLRKHISFVDCPGHEYLMATMLSATTVMDSVFLLIAANEECPQPTTNEHLAALEIMKIPNIILIQNKLDLVQEEKAKEQYANILKFVSGTIASTAPVIPISAMEKLNIDSVCEFIDKYFPVPKQNYHVPPKMTIIRSFSANNAGGNIENLKGGIAGGSLVEGVLKLGDKIEIRPGVVTRDKKGTIKCQPILSTVISLQAEKQMLHFAVPCGLIGVGTDIDPSLCLGDKLSGQTLGLQGKLPEISIELTIQYCLLQNILGVRNVQNFKQQGGMSTRVKMLQKNENVMLNIGSLSTGCNVSLVLSQKGNSGEENLATIVLKTPVCAKVGQNCSISRKYDTTWRLIGMASIVKTVTIEPVYD